MVFKFSYFHGLLAQLKYYTCSFIETLLLNEFSYTITRAR